MIYESLPFGAFNGLTGEQLRKYHNISTGRELQKIIREERLNGKPILNKGNVYFRSDDPQDYKLWGRTTFWKGAHTIEVVRAVMKLCPVDDGQITIEDLFDLLDEDLTADEEHSDAKR